MSQPINQLPQWPKKLIRLLLNQDYVEELEGDLEEIYHKNLELYTERKARRLYIKELLKLIRPQLLRNFEGKQRLNTYGMLKNNLKIAIRVFRKDKVYSLINVLGMATGLSIAMLILLYAQFEMSYESYNPNAERVVRLTMDYLNGEVVVDQDVETYSPLGPKIKTDFSEVEEFARVYRLSEVTLNVDNKNFREAKAYAADPAFFEMFGHPFVQGTDEEVFKNPFEAVFTESLAVKMFGNTDIVGKGIFVPDTGQNLTVVGVVKDSPANTHLKFNLIVSFNTMYQYEQGLATQWDYHTTYTYLLLNRADQYHSFVTNLSRLNDQLHEIGLMQGERAISQKITDIHLYSDKPFEPEQNGDGAHVIFLIGVALMVIVISIVNYINLSTAKAMDRAKEVGVRKVMGSTLSQLRFQFFTESLLVSALAGAIAVLAMVLLFDVFRQTANLPSTLTFLDRADFWLLLGAILAVSTLISGIFPAIILSSYKPIAILKGKYTHSKGGVLLRKGLVIFQFAITIFLLVQTLAANWQLDFMRSKDLGLNVEQTIVVRTPHTDELRGKFAAFKNDLLNQSTLANVALSESVPGLPTIHLSTGKGVNPVDALEVHNFNFYVNRVDSDYLETMQMELLAGGNFIPESKNANMVIVNEAAIRLWGYESPEQAVGKKLDMWGAQRTIIGVIKNYQQLTAKTNYQPTIFLCMYNNSFYSYASIRTSSTDYKSQLSTVAEIYESHFPAAPFDYFFLDQEFDKLYREDEQFQTVFSLLTGFAILIAALGLFGLASFTVSKRSKEIGIRKVLGAEVSQLMALISKEFVWLVLISMVFAVPVAYISVNNWLDSYAFRIDVTPGLFIVPAVGVLLVSFVAIFSKTLGVATANPVTSLRDE
ncbi:MAG: FtsX-like permease family protein [Bacteroidota bacterium]